METNRRKMLPRIALSIALALGLAAGCADGEFESTRFDDDPSAADGIGTSPSEPVDSIQPELQVVCDVWENYACGTTPSGGILVCRRCVCWHLSNCKGGDPTCSWCSFD